MTPSQGAANEAPMAPAESARAIGLRYVTDEMPGIRRERSGGGFRYRYPTGDIVRDAQVLRRIHALAIPPAWTQVWICPDPAGHLQATGRDDRHRKQSRYHPLWREIRDETKYAHMISFARALPRIRRRVGHDLRLRGLPRAKVLASVVRLLEVSLIRVGNPEYARENESFGLTTLRNRHVEVNGPNLRFHFRGKSGKWHNVDIHDPGLARIVRSCQDLPGQELFQYLSDDGKRQAISSEDVNQYLRDITGEDFTAKDFRTWAGTLLAAAELSEVGDSQSLTQARKGLATAVKAVAERLGNTPAVCRKCYIHPDIIESYLSRGLIRELGGTGSPSERYDLRKLRPMESAVLRLLEARVKASRRQLGSLLQASLKSVSKRRRGHHHRRLALLPRRPRQKVGM